LNTGLSDYYPGGMQMPGRGFTAASTTYRYGFNGKEKDPNMTSEDYDYGMRIYDARTGRFLSVDPMSKTYPWYTPYQFAGDNPIKFIDLDGLEPAAPGTVDKNGSKIIHTVEPGTRKPYNLSGGEDVFNKQPNLDAIGTNTMVEPGVIHDLLAEKSESATTFHEYTNTNTAFIISPNAKGTDAGWINLMLGNYMWGQGYENWVFPENGSVTPEMKNSNIVAKALMSLGGSSNFHSKMEYTADDQAENLFRYKTPLSMENFVGSADTYLKVNNDRTISVSVFNVTSITSGDLLKHLPMFSWPVSVVRDKPGYSADRGLTPWSNTSQTFNFTLNQNEAAQLISNYQQRMNDFNKFIGIVTQPAGHSD
jgi:RHS repeat-associated protein